ncbi:hypothetical protein A1OS_21090 [Enterovibrio norvegicus]|nr:hypothetical protein A1OS_21090 [Enterovibrio norvegicus]
MGVFALPLVVLTVWFADFCFRNDPLLTNKLTMLTALESLLAANLLTLQPHHFFEQNLTTCTSNAK